MKSKQLSYLQNRVPISELPINWKAMVYTTESFYDYTISTSFNRWKGEMEDDEKEAGLVLSQIGLHRGQSIIDIACGFGRIAEVFAKNYELHVTGIDISKGLIEIANRNAKEKSLSIEYLHGDPIYSFPDKHFDAACILNNSFSLFSPAEAPTLLKTIHDHLNSNGILFIDIDNKIYNCRYGKEDSNWGMENGSLFLQEIFYHVSISVEVCRDIYLDLEEDKFDESIIYKRIYELNEITKLVEKAEFKVKAVYGDWLLNELNVNSPKIILKLQKK